MLKSAIYGFAIGDALGVPYEFRQRNTYVCNGMIGYGTWEQPKGTWSDDTSMTLATCESIKAKNKIDLNDIFNNFKLWVYKGMFTAHNELFDIGNTTREAILKGSGIDDINSNGNGSLMRILPLAFIECTDEDIENVSALTHAHEISKEACVIYVHIARELIKGRNIKDILKEVKCSDIYARVPYIYDLDENDIKSSGYVVDTLEASLWCVATTTSYNGCVLKAVNLGGDTDTVTAIAGGLAGIIYGYDNIPKEWVDNLANKELIEKCLFKTSK